MLLVVGGLDISRLRRISNTTKYNKTRSVNHKIFELYKLFKIDRSKLKYFVPNLATLNVFSYNVGNGKNK